MKIRHQLIFLLGLPLACQLLTVGILIYSYGRVDELANRELRAKRAIAIGLQIRTTLEQSVLAMATQSIIGANAATEKVENQREKLNADFRALRKLTASEPEAGKIIAECEKHSKQFLDLWEDLALAYQPSQGDQLFFSQFLGRDEFSESLTLAFNRIRQDTDKLKALYSPIAQEFHPQAVKARENLRIAIVLAVFFNLALSAGFAVMLNRNTLMRLAILSENMRAFSRGESTMVRLKGNDELSELDQNFSKMAEELTRLDELRKSMQAMVSHDLRSPLTSMGLRVELMLGNSTESLSAATTRNLKLLSSEIERLRRLANTLLDIDKIQDGSLKVELSPVVCQDIVAVSVEAVLAQSKRKEIEISSNLVEDAVFLCDKDRTIQVLVNFLSNAVKFAPKGSKIQVELKESTENFLRLSVIDEGPGIPEEQRNRLFNKFSQLEQPSEIKKEGSGLGLYICKLLIEVQNGKLGFEPVESGGTCFYFELPRALATKEQVSL